MLQRAANDEHTLPDPESFIPLSRSELIEHCLATNKLDQHNSVLFQQFCEILAAFFHHDLHDEVEQFKAAYAALNPDTESSSNIEESDDPGGRVAALFRGIVERANFREVADKELRQALEEMSLVDVRTDVNLQDYARVEAFCRGDVWTKMKVKRLFFWEKEIEVDILQRVALLLQFKDCQYFEAIKRRSSTGSLPFKPGKIYLFLYKDVPKNDLELLFPNVNISMNWKDRLLIGVPAVGAAIPVMLKMMPKVLIIAGVIAFFTLGADFAQELGVRRDTIRDFMPIAAATLAVTIALGGFAFKQYNNFKNKKIKFQRDVSDTLFFRNLATNVSVLHRLIDQAEEAETKEAILVYYHLLINQHRRLTAAELDAQIEQWMLNEIGTAIDFDIEGPIDNLQRIRHADGRPLLHRDVNGCCGIQPLEDAIQIVDNTWDRIFGFTFGIDSRAKSDAEVRSHSR